MLSNALTLSWAQMMHPKSITHRVMLVSMTCLALCKRKIQQLASNHLNDIVQLMLHPLTNRLQGLLQEVGYQHEPNLPIPACQ